MNFLKRVVLFLIMVMLLASMTLTAFATGTESQSQWKEFSGITFGEVDERVYAIIDVNIRTGPGVTYEKLGQLPYGYSIRRIGIGDNGWSRVLYNGQEAYMFSGYLSTTKPANSTQNLDDEKLNRQMAIANGLKQYEYTKESWSAVADAMIKADNALNGNKQEDVDAATEELQSAIAALKTMDYSQLSTALAQVSVFGDAQQLHELWLELAQLVGEGNDLLTSGDQAAVDETAEQINQLLADVESGMLEQNTPEVVTKEVYVEVPPAGNYCNLSSHHFWPVVVIFSMALNVGLVVLIVFYVSKRVKNQKDDTPLVDYDISDDTF